MTATASVAKPSKSSASASDKAETTASLREVMPKKFHASGDLRESGVNYEILHVTAGADWTLDDVLAPIAWTNVAHRVAKDPLQHRNEQLNSTVFVHAPHFFAMLNIDAVLYDQLGNPNGLKVTCMFHAPLGAARTA